MNPPTIQFILNQFNKFMPTYNVKHQMNDKNPQGP